MYEEHNNNKCPICRKKIIDIESQIEEVQEVRHCCFKNFDIMVSCMVKFIILIILIVILYTSCLNIYLTVTKEYDYTIIIASGAIILCVMLFLVIFLYKKINKYAVFCNKQ